MSNNNPNSKKYDWIWKALDWNNIKYENNEQKQPIQQIHQIQPIYSNNTNEEITNLQIEDYKIIQSNITIPEQNISNLDDKSICDESFIIPI